MTLQEIFQTSATRLLEQNSKSRAPNGFACQYFAEDGNCCAVGLLFKDSPAVKSEIIQNSWNNKGIYDLICESPVVRGFLGLSFQRSEGDYEAEDLLCKLQSVHDQLPVAEWPNALLKLGVDFNLDTSFLTTQPA